MDDKLSTEEIGCAMVIMFIFTAIVLFVGVGLITSENKPQVKDTALVVVEAPKPPVTLITADQWEKLNTKLLRDDYHLDHIRRDIIQDFITTNKDKVEQAQEEGIK